MVTSYAYQQVLLASGPVHATCHLPHQGKQWGVPHSPPPPRTPDPQIRRKRHFWPRTSRVPTPTAEQRRDASGQPPTSTNDAPLDQRGLLPPPRSLVPSLHTFFRRPKDTSGFQSMNPATVVPSCFLCYRPGLEPHPSPVTDASRAGRTPPCHTTPLASPRPRAYNTPRSPAAALRER